MNSSTLKHDQPSTLKSIVIPTCNRPAALDRCLSTLLANVTAYGHKPRVVIADGSTSERAVIDNQEVVARFKAKGAPSVNLLGPRERARLVARLIAAGLDGETVAFGTSGLELGLGCAGANRNVLLLATIGQRFISVDDDIECSFVAPDQFGTDCLAGISLSDCIRESPISYQFFPDRKCLHDSVDFRQIDFVGVHDAVLGAQVRDPALSTEPRCNDSVDVHASPPPSEGSPVVLTLSGLIGDCGWGTPSRNLFVSEASWERLTRSDEIYLQSTTTREVAQLSEGLALTRNPDDLMTAAFGADALSALPPFVPIGRGEDILLGHILRKTRSDAWFAHLPHAIFHNPFERRRFGRGEIIRSASTTDLSSLLIAMVQRATVRSLDSFGPLQDLGRSLTEIGFMPIATFKGYLRECRKVATLSQVQFLKNRLSLSNGAVPVYVDHVKSYIRRLMDGDETEEAGIPVELLYGRDVDVALSLTQKVVRLYGQLLVAWPNVIDAIGESPWEYSN